MFTIDPVTGDNNIVIEATWGLGEYLVLGEVDPDHYTVSKDGRILDVKIGKKPIALVRDYGSDRSVPIRIPREKIEAKVLSDEELLKLAKYGQQLEEHYGQPQDIEFAIEKNILRIVQTRGVTTKAKKSTAKIEGIELLHGLGASPGIASGVVKIIKDMNDVAKIEGGDVLVTTMTSPDLVPTMSKAAAIITDLGGSNCHAAIVSREMGIPAIVGTHDATKFLKDRQTVTVDAYHGSIYEGRIEVEKPAEELGPTGPTVTKIKVNLVFAEKLEVAEKVDGVGLLRVEHMITKFGIHPARLLKEGRIEGYTRLLISGIKPIAQAFGQKPVWVRTLDARSDEFRNLLGGDEEPNEDNPMLGWHGIRRSLDQPELLKAEFEAVKRLHEEGLTNVHIMLPFVISVDEFVKSKKIATEIGMPETVKIGIMVETPAAAMIIEDFCKAGIGFVSFGTNDLTQLTLGIDRNNAQIANLSSEFHPAVLKMMQNVIEVCNNYNIESSVCGESASNPEMAKILVKYGIRSVSCNIDAIDRIRSAVYAAENELLQFSNRSNLQQ
jgi:pyruvate,water dikinase